MPPFGVKYRHFVSNKALRRQGLKARINSAQWQSAASPWGLGIGFGFGILSLHGFSFPWAVPRAEMKCAFSALVSCVNHSSNSLFQKKITFFPKKFVELRKVRIFAKVS